MQWNLSCVWGLLIFSDTSLWALASRQDMPSKMEPPPFEEFHYLIQNPLGPTIFCCYLIKYPHLKTILSVLEIVTTIRMVKF